ncbi:unnamed protein product [Toxocara canis]|uniref:PSI_integrin domain-containing protein n=1 Tax=Toxocara canis TaxID=6265 RepID=A0A183VFW5_TOXCA|nr:unnamed protein product [Toxocara canis]
MPIVFAVTATVLDSKKDFPCYSLPRENYTCSACIQFHDTCAWCSKVVLTATVLDSKKDFPCYSLPRENYTCSACIQFHDTCAWCSKVGFDDENQHPRCDSLDRLIEHGCPDGDIEFPKTTVDTTEVRSFEFHL